jgi:hypothetical protein
VLFQLRHVSGRIAAGQQTTVYHRMQGLDAAIQNFRGAGNVGYLGDRNAGIGEAAMGAARTDKFIAGVGEGFAEMLDTGFIEYAE